MGVLNLLTRISGNISYFCSKNKMKVVFRFLPLLLLLSSCYTRENNCKKFKTGTFEYSTYADGNLLKAKIFRNDTMEIDYFDVNNPDTASIRWVNDCEYVVRKYHPKSQVEKQAYHIEIIETNKDTYTFEFSRVGESSQIKQITAKRVK